MDDVIPLLYEFDKFKIPTHAPNQNSCGLWPNERTCLTWLALNAPPGDFVEIGSHQGASTLLLCLARQLQKRGPKIYTIDIKYGEHFDTNISNGMFWPMIRKINGTSKTFKELLGNIQPAISLVFIDAFHSFKCVVEDFENAVSHLIDGATVVFHDTSPAIYENNNNSYIETCTKTAVSNYNKWIKDEKENFLVDEAICYLSQKYKLTPIAIPVRKFEFYPERTGLNKWVRGTTSSYNAIMAMRYTT